MLSLLLDNHLRHVARPLRQKDPALTVWCVDDPGMPARDTDDDVLLLWCEAHAIVLVTKDVNTMPGYLAAHLTQGRHVPGIIVINRDMGVGEIVDRPALAARIVEPAEVRDQFRYLRSL